MKKSKRKFKKAEPWPDRCRQIVDEALAAISAANHHPDTPDDNHRGFLPLAVSHSLEMACFISGTVRAAQNAERAHGVPTSVLIAFALDDCGDGWDYRTLVPDVQSYFMELAKALKGDRQFRPALAVAADPDAFAEELRRWGMWGADSLKQLDMLGRMKKYELHELNVVHVIPESIRARRCDEAEVLGVLKDALAEAFNPRKVHPARLRSAASWIKSLQCEQASEGSPEAA